jgi:hypothetical protein
VVEALTIGVVLGFTFISGLGLLVVAAAHYLGLARLVFGGLLLESFGMEAVSYPFTLHKVCSLCPEMLLGRSFAQTAISGLHQWSSRAQRQSTRGLRVKPTSMFQQVSVIPNLGPMGL